MVYAVNSYALELQDISKDFSGVVVLHGVNLNVKKGEIHALVGENGAGKSTMMKILSGVYSVGQYAGTIRVNGEERVFAGIKDSEDAGIGIIYQELELVRQLSVAENIFLGNEPKKGGLIDRDALYLGAESVLRRMGVHIPVDTLVDTIGVGLQQMVCIAKALIRNTSILILDEPTAALTEQETETLFRILRELKKDGVTCIYISHKLQEIRDLCDTVSVLRDGRIIATEPIGCIDEDTIIRHMVGREITDRFAYTPGQPGKVMLRVENFCVRDASGRVLDEDVSFEARAGEVLGIAGLMGSGRTELLTTLYGATEYAKSGRVELDGQEVHIKTPSDALRCGMALLSEDRKAAGLVMCLNVMNNMSLSSLKDMSRCMVMDEDEERRQVGIYVDKMKIKVHSLEALVDTLSGGNQQKVTLGKALLTKPKVLLLDEPTRGVDMGAKHEIYTIMNQLKAEGAAIVMISSELPEVLGVSDRIMVMREGRKAGELAKAEATQENIMHLAAIGGN